MDHKRSRSIGKHEVNLTAHNNQGFRGRLMPLKNGPHYPQSARSSAMSIGPTTGIVVSAAGMSLAQSRLRRRPRAARRFQPTAAFAKRTCVPRTPLASERPTAKNTAPTIAMPMGDDCGNCRPRLGNKPQRLAMIRPRRSERRSMSRATRGRRSTCQVERLTYRSARVCDRERSLAIGRSTLGLHGPCPASLRCDNRLECGSCRAGRLEFRSQPRRRFQPR